MFHLDFEDAAIKAAKKVWPDTRIVTCDTHWKRALRNGQSQSGLTAMVNQDSDMQNWCRTVWALCFVPEEEVLKVWTDVIHKSAPFVAEPDDPDYDGSLSLEEVIHCNGTLPWIIISSISNIPGLVVSPPRLGREGLVSIRFTFGTNRRGPRGVRWI